MGLFGNWKKCKETEFFVGSVEEALNRYDPEWTKLSFDHIRNAVKHLINIQKINAVYEILPVGWDYVAKNVVGLKALYDRDGHSDPAQSCQFILDCCNRYLGRAPEPEPKRSPKPASKPGSSRSKKWTSKIECPHCGQRIQISAADLGRVAPCPNCRVELKIPSPKPDEDSSAEELAATFSELASAGAAQLTDFFLAVQPTSDERRRILLALKLFPIAVALGETDLGQHVGLEKTIAQAGDIYLNQFTKQDQIVRCGDYVIWRIERDNVIDLLSCDYGELIVENHFNSHQIRYGLLIHALAGSRRRAFCADWRFALHQASEVDPRETLKLILKCLALSFTRQVIDTDPTSPTITPLDEARVDNSMDLAMPPLFSVYSGVRDALKALETEHG